MQKGATRRARPSARTPATLRRPAFLSPPLTERWGLWSPHGGETAAAGSPRALPGPTGVHAWRFVWAGALCRRGLWGPRRGPANRAADLQPASPPPVLLILGHRRESSRLSAQPPSRIPQTSGFDSRRLPPSALQAGGPGSECRQGRVLARSPPGVPLLMPSLLRSPIHLGGPS